MSHSSTVLSVRESVMFILSYFRKHREERTAKFPTAHPFLWLALDPPEAPFLSWPVLH